MVHLPNFGFSNHHPGNWHYILPKMILYIQYMLVMQMNLRFSYNVRYIWIGQSLGTFATLIVQQKYPLCKVLHSAIRTLTFCVYIREGSFYRSKLFKQQCMICLCEKLAYISAVYFDGCAQTTGQCMDFTNAHKKNYTSSGKLCGKNVSTDKNIQRRPTCLLKVFFVQP